MFNHLFPVDPEKGRKDSKFMSDILGVSYEAQAYNEGMCRFYATLHTCKPVDSQVSECPECCEKYCEC